MRIFFVFRGCASIQELCAPGVCSEATEVAVSQDLEACRNQEGAGPSD